MNIKEIYRLSCWIAFSINNKGGFGRNVLEVGSGNSQRIPTLLNLLRFKGNYFNCNSDPIFQKYASKNFYSEYSTSDFLKLEVRSKFDSIIFDHSLDDIIAFRISKRLNPKENNYQKILENVKKFDPKDKYFQQNVNEIFKKCYFLLNKNGKIIISNYLTKYDKARRSKNITRHFLEWVEILSPKNRLKTIKRGKGFLVLEINSTVS